MKYKLEVFGGNHLLEASRNVVTNKIFDGEDEKLVQYVDRRTCIVYQGLTDDEMLQVQSFLLITS